MRNIKYIIVLIFVILIPSVFISCAVKNNCKSPELNIPESYYENSLDSVSLIEKKWWEFYTDPHLQRLIDKTLANNRDMKIALANITKMAELNRINTSYLLPELNGTISGLRETNDYYQEKEIIDDELSVKATLSWELDFRGALRWGRKKGISEYLSSIEAKKAMQMTLVATVASAYFELVALDNELDIVKRTLITRREGVSQAKIRFEGGLTSETSYQQAQVELASTAALIPELETKIAIKESEIALLSGELPNEQKRSMVMNNKELPTYKNVGLPAELILRRPDVQQALQELNAAKAQVGIKHAERFPKVIISITGGVENDDWTNIFKSPFSYTLGSITAPLFNFGRNKAKFKAAVAEYEQARMKYEKKVLTCFKEVNDAIITYNNAHKSSLLKSDLRDASRKYVNLARLQYINGVINYLDVLDAQRKYFDAEIGLNNSIKNEYLALVQLYKALGGGWETPSETDKQ